MRDDLPSLPMAASGKALARKRGLKDMTNTRKWDRMMNDFTGTNQSKTMAIKDVGVGVGKKTESEERFFAAQDPASGNWGVYDSQGSPLGATLVQDCKYDKGLALAVSAHKNGQRSESATRMTLRQICVAESVAPNTSFHGITHYTECGHTNRCRCSCKNERTMIGTCPACKMGLRGKMFG